MYLRPAALEEALDRLGAGARLLAGGTDLMVGADEAALRGDVVDISRLPELRGVSRAGDELRIGGATTWSEIARADLPPAFDALQAAAREIGAVQIQNRATLGGNLCNASPAADGVPPLLALDAEVELASPRGVRRLPLAQFLAGPRRTQRAAGRNPRRHRLPRARPRRALGVPETRRAALSRHLHRHGRRRARRRGRRRARGAGRRRRLLAGRACACRPPSARLGATRRRACEL